ncbi:MAG: hypothetical protein Q9222_002168 [Ikaeria aurantiellina]
MDKEPLRQRMGVSKEENVYNVLGVEKGYKLLVKLAAHAKDRKINGLRKMLEIAPRGGRWTLDARSEYHERETSMRTEAGWINKDARDCITQDLYFEFEGEAQECGTRT